MSSSIPGVLEAARLRRLIHQSTDEHALAAHLQEDETTFYLGFDPTAASLHVGHLVPIMLARLLVQHGHRAVLLLGGFTASVGDPTGRVSARPVLSREELSSNAHALQRQLLHLFRDCPEGKVSLVNNLEWLGEMLLHDFIASVGRQANLNRLLQSESVESRLAEGGMTLAELLYATLQGADFLELRRRGTTLQVGGSDQWGNMLSGLDLIRKAGLGEAHVLTTPLLLQSDGMKMGKTAGGAMWLDPHRVQPFDFWQFWRNVTDEEVGRILPMLAEISSEELQDLLSLKGSSINQAKIRLAGLVTTLVHGEEASRAAELAASAVFKQQEMRADLASLPAAKFEQDTDILEVLRELGFTESRSAGRRLIAQAGVSFQQLTAGGDVSRSVISDPEMKVSGLFSSGSAEVLLNVGRKRMARILSS